MNPENEILWNVKCDCGKQMIASQDDLTSGKVTSCGCTGGDYFYCESEDGILISSTPIVTCKKQSEKN
jgi:hypothetical protein